MKRVTATVLADPAIFDLACTCYVGITGANNGCDITNSEAGSVVFSTTNLSPGAELTIAQSLKNLGTPLELERPRFNFDGISYLGLILSLLFIALLGVALFNRKMKSIFVWLLRGAGMIFSLLLFMVIFIVTMPMIVKLYGLIYSGGMFWYVVSGIGLVVLYGLFTYFWFTAHNDHASVVTEYEPFANLPPMYTGYLYDGRLDGRDIVAGLVDLARRGFIKIRHVNKKVLLFFSDTDYEVTLLKPIAEIDSVFQVEVLKLLFESTAVGTTISLDPIRVDHRKQRTNQHIFSLLRLALRKDVIRRGVFYNQ